MKNWLKFEINYSNDSTFRARGNQARDFQLRISEEFSVSTNWYWKEQSTLVYSAKEFKMLGCN